LKSHFDEDVELHKIYRYLDKLQSSQKDTVQKISVEHTKKILGGKIGLSFYDVTTLYFETDYSDSLRKPEFSKDGRGQQSADYTWSFGECRRLSIGVFDSRRQQVRRTYDVVYS